ncbi:hypothetical protein FC63_GL000636 [Lactobacillus amylovorus DSM 20531]|jgi:RsiW-degrading membrane proteinase PrsW (M82 family)|nr:hypothetical protein FC63_GL000636 [Lactobacillus amylovorus DSM 20531]
MIWFVFWNQFCGDGNNLWQVLFKANISPLELTWNIWFMALEAGIFEEPFRY